MWIQSTRGHLSRPGFFFFFFERRATGPSRFIVGCISPLEPPSGVSRGGTGAREPSPASTETDRPIFEFRWERVWAQDDRKSCGLGKLSSQAKT